jgi:predicted secreted protein
LETRAAQQSAPQPTLNLQQVERGRIEAELRAAHASFKTRWDNIAETPWAQTENNDPREGQNSSFTTIIAGAIPFLRKLSREDLSEFRKAQRTLLDSYEQVFSLFQKAQTKGFDPFDPGVGLAGWYPNLAIWQAAQRVHAIAYEQSGLIEENWEEWRRSGSKSKEKQKPWQEKAQQLQSGFDSAFKEWQGLR